MEHDYVCDICGKPAMYCLQQIVHLYSVDNKGDTKELSADQLGETEWYCEECKVKYQQGELHKRNRTIL